MQYTRLDLTNIEQLELNGDEPAETDRKSQLKEKA